MAYREMDSASMMHRPRTVTLTASLLMAEWFGFLSLGVFHMVSGLDRYAPSPGAIRLLGGIGIQTDHARLLSGIFLLLSLSALISAVGFFQLRYLAWLLATLTQGIALLTAILLYFSSGPPFAFLIMLYSSIIVAYLNYPEVQEAFRSREIEFCKRVSG